MDGLLGLGWYALLIAMSGDLRVSLVLPIFYSEYNIMKMSISILGNSESPVWIHFNIWMFLEGLLFLDELPDFYIYGILKIPPHALLGHRLSLLLYYL